MSYLAKVAAMIKSTGFHRIAKQDYDERMNSEPSRVRSPTEEGKERYLIRRRKEEILEAIALKKELESFG